VPALLLVHDDPDTLDWLTTLFEAHGYEVAIGATAFAARSKLERTEITAILAGLDVGAGTGHSLIEWAKAERPALLERFLVLAENDDDILSAAEHGLSSLGPKEYDAILKWLSAIPEMTQPKPAIGFEPDQAPQLLLLEDDPHQAILISDILKNYGFAIHICSELAEARERIDDSFADPIDVVLSDWYLREGNGAELYDWLLAEHPELADRCIFISGGSMREIRQRAPLASAYPKGQDSRILVAALTRAARAAKGEGR